MNTKSIGLLIVAFGILSSCGPKDTPVKELPPALKNDINQNLQNGVIPTPQQVREGEIPPAVNLCEKFRKAIPDFWVQDFLEVPENPADPAGRKIKIFYYGKVKPGAVPTVFFNGGPGADSHGSAFTLQETKPKYDKENNISFIYIDQRGNGCSDFYPQMADNTKPDLETLKRLSLYGSTGIVADAEAVRSHLLGSKKWNVFGQSYGALIVHRYAVNSPEGVNAGFAHANTLNKDGYQRVKTRLASQARVFGDYLKKNPDDEKRFQKLADFLTIDHCYHGKNKDQKICGAEVLQIFAAFLGFQTDWAEIHKWVKEMAPDEISETGIGEFLATFYFGGVSNPLQTKAYAGAVISYTDRNVPLMDRYVCYRAQKDLKAESNIELQNVFVSECVSNLQWNSVNKPDFSKEPEAPQEIKLIQSLPRDLLTPEKFAEKLTASTALQFYLYSGQKDSVVPEANFQEELSLVRELPNLHYTHFPESGHDGFYSEPQVWADILQHSGL